jgi:hypothetical protein
MEHKVVRLVTLVITLFLLLPTLFGCSHDEGNGYSNDPQSLTNYDDVRYYIFDPHTIFTAMVQMDRNIFQPATDKVRENNAPSETLTWQPNDYLKVANTLNLFIKQDELEDWSIYQMFFTGNCANSSSGFDNAYLTYFKAVGKYYTTREIYISISEEKAVWAGEANFPRPFLFDWNDAASGKIKVDANEAFQIAEKNGGLAARQSVKNNCHFNMITSPNAGYQYENWQVEYRGKYEEPLFKIIINPYDGKFETITP